MIGGNKLLLIAIALPLITLLIIGTKTYESIISFQDQTKFIEETHQLILSLQNLLTLIINAETGQRGFIITGNEAYLEPYNFSINNLNSTIEKIENLVSDKHSDLLNNANFNIFSLIHGKIYEMEKSLAMMKSQGFNASVRLLATEEGKQLMDNIRQNISLIINEEERILQSNTDQSVIDGQNLLTIYIIGIAVSSVVTTIAIILTYSQLNLKHIQITEMLQKEINKKTRQLKQSNIYLKKSNEDLEKNDAMQKEFINIAAHELRTPVQSIVGYLEMVKNFPENFKKYLEPLERNSERLYRLTEDILDIARIESNNFKLNKEKFDIGQLLSETADEFITKNQIINKEKNNEIQLLYPDEYNQNNLDTKSEFLVYADKNRIQQVVLNLLSNASKFTNDGKIVIKINKEYENQIKVSIQDNGKGIDEEILPTLFTKFNTKSEAGTGLGLYLSKNIINSHGGSIRGYNNLDGKPGATFEFTIPISKNLDS
ncbi:MAG TPA: CHASE3 domain-containing protein [Nitrososphaeraceae archaeon]|nr:CHASE3 domain-containing protein [Nitrososphaeraceae archaeon]